MKLKKLSENAEEKTYTSLYCSFHPHLIQKFKKNNVNKNRIEHVCGNMHLKKRVNRGLNIVFFLLVLFFYTSINTSLASAFSPPASGFFVQHGMETMSTATLDIPITPISNLSHAFVIVHQWTNQATTASTVNANYAMVGAYLKNESTVTLERSGITRNIYVTWMVVEALNDEFTVQQGTSAFTLNGGVLSTTVTIPTAVNITNSFAWQTFNTTLATDDGDDMFFAANITNPTTINFLRGGATAAITGTLRWFVVEWNTSKIASFQKGITNLVGNEIVTAPKIQLINQINNLSSFLFFQCIGTGASSTPDQSSTSGAINNDTSIMFYARAATTSYARRCFWEVIDFGSHVGKREKANGVTVAGTANFVNPPLQINRSLAFLYSTSSATAATRYPSGGVYYNFSTSAIDYGRTYITSNTMTASWEILELPFNYWPNVTALLYPNGQNLNTRNVSFNFTVTNITSGLANCSVWGNFSGAWAQNKTSYTISGTATNTINISIPDGSYKWNIKCLDSYGDSDMYDSNNTFNLDATPPSVSNSILNQTILNQTHSVRLNVTISDANNLTIYQARITYPDTSISDLSFNKSSGNNYYLDFNYTTQNGTYNVTSITATDSFGNTNYTTYTNLNFTVTLSPPNAFNLLMPLNATESQILQPNMTWQQAYDENFDYYNLQMSTNITFSNPEYNYTFTGLTNTSKILDILTDNTIYYWRVIAYDIFGSQTNSTGIFTYTTDSNLPTVILNNPQDGSWVLSNPVLFNYTSNDANTLNTCVLYANFSGSFLQNISNTTLSKLSYNYFTLSLSEGTYLWNIRCNDSASNYDFAIANQTIKIDLTPPNITLFAPNTSHYENTTNNIIITINATDTWTDISSCSVIVDGVVEKTRNNIFNGILYNFTEFMLNGNYNWSVNCTDVNGFEGASETRNITVNVTDNNPPLASLNFPLPTAYSQTENITFNYTVEDATGISNCSIYLDGILNNTDFNIENFEYNYFQVDNIAEGTHAWKIECVDNSSPEYNSGFSNIRNLTIDLIAPTILTDSLSPKNNTFVNISNVIFTFIPNETNLDYCSLYGNFSGAWLEAAQNITPTNLQNNTIPDILLDGIYTWSIQCFDKSGRNASYPENYTINIDTTFPGYSNIVTEPNTNFVYSKTQTYEFNITWTDNFAIDTVIIETNFSGILQNTTLTDSSSSVYNFTTGPIGVGNYIYKWYANDTSGNHDETLSHDYSIIQATPLINITFNGTEGDYSINEGESLNITTFINDSDSGLLEIYIDGVLSNNGISQLSNITTFANPGVYNITSYYYSTQNYTNGFTTYYLTVNDTTKPVVTSIFPTQDAIVGSSSVTFQYNVTDFSNIQNCDLYINNTYNNTDTTVTKDITQTFTKTLNNGTYTYKINCTDIANNYGNSTTKNFTISPVPGITVNVSTNRPTYVYNYLVNTTINTYAGQAPQESNLTTDIILGNSSVPWWNTSWLYRKPIRLNDTINFSHTEWITLNVSGLAGNITNCTKEIRIIDNTNPANLSLATSRISGGDNSNYCIVEFNADITAGAVNENNYYAYYKNSAASDPGFSFSPVQINVQRGIINAATGTVIGANLQNSVDISKSFLIFTSLSSGTLPTTGMFTGNLSSSTRVDFTRYATAVGNISWQIIEHPWINVQRGSATITTAQVNININPVDISRSFIIVNGRVNTGTAGRQTRGMFSATFVNSTTISLTRASTTTSSIADYQVVEWPGATVQNGTATIGAAATSVTANIASVNKNNTFIIFSSSYSAISGNIQDISAYGKIINSTQLLFSRVGVTGSLTIPYFAVTIPGINVLEDLSNFPAATIQALPALSRAITLNKTFSLSSWNTTGAVTTFTGLYHLINITNTTNLNIKKQISTYVSSVATYIPQVELTNFSRSSISAQEKFITRNTSQTGDNGLGKHIFIWNTTNNVTGNYSIISTASSAGLNDGAGHAHFQIIIDTTPPNFTLNYPVNTFNTTASLVNFNWTPTDDFSTFINCTLKLNTTNYTGINTTSGTATNYTLTLGIGNYSWNVSCSDNANNTNTSLTRSIVIIGAPIITNVTYNTTDNKSIILYWTQGYGAVTYDIYIKTNFSQNFSSIPNVTGITSLNWTDNQTNSSAEKYYSVATNRSSAKILSTEIAAKKDVALNGSWVLATFAFNSTYNRLGNFSNYTNPLIISPKDAITAIYRTKAGSCCEQVNYNSSGWTQTIGSENFTNIELGKGYWFEMNKNATITYYGIIVTNNFNLSLYQGWNLIGSISPINLTFKDLGTEPPATPITLTPTNSITYLYRYNSNDTSWDQVFHVDDSGWWINVTPLKVLEPNRGYYADTSQNTTWEVGK